MDRYWAGDEWVEIAHIAMEDIGWQTWVTTRDVAQAAGMFNMPHSKKRSHMTLDVLRLLERSGIVYNRKVFGTNFWTLNIDGLGYVNSTDCHAGMEAGRSTARSVLCPLSEPAPWQTDE